MRIDRQINGKKENMADGTIRSNLLKYRLLKDQDDIVFTGRGKFLVWALIAVAAGISLLFSHVFLPAFIMSLLMYFPGLYVYRKTVRVIGNNSIKKYLFPVLLLLTISFPLGFLGINITRKYTDSFIFNAFYEIGIYYMPVLLYSFLFALLADIFKLLNKIFKVFKPSLPLEKKIMRSYFAVSAAATAALVIVGVFEFHDTRISEYEITMPAKTSALQNLRIVMASDFHLTHNTAGDFVKKTVDKINSLNPGLVLIPGDILDSYESFVKGKGYSEDFRKLKARYGVFAVTGNHEYYGNLKTALKFIRNSGMDLLQDTIININGQFYLAGRNDRTDKNRKPLAEILRNKKEDIPVLLMDHQPNALDETLPANIDLQVSGHTHNGQLFPFNYITDLVYKLSWGYEKIGNTNLFVSCGIGGWGPQIRTNSYSEIMVIDIKFK